MAENYSITPLTSLNAIKLSAREVARTFVAPPAFEMLLHADNAVLTGPRGSGKTTLLKMMQSEALEHWDCDSAEVARTTVRAVGVFIGSDRTWNEQLAIPGNEIDQPSRSALTTAAFTSHVLRSLVEAMEYRIGGTPAPSGASHKRVEMERSAEAELAGRLCAIFHLPVSATSLATVRALLMERLVEIGRLRTVIQRQGSIDVPEWADLEFVTTTDAAADAFNSAAGQPDQKWALLFDELELAPVELVDKLLAALRGNQPRLLFKLSLAPAHSQFHVLDEENAPVAGQDYEHVPLTYARKLPALDFAKDLVRATLGARSTTRISPEKLLGSGVLDGRDDLDETSYDLPASSYAVGKPLQKTMEALAAKDASFRAYLERNSIDLEHLEELPANVRASRVRKIRNIVVAREYFRDENGKRRSRKTLGLYVGADTVLSLPDGNPRMIIALVRQLFPTIDESTQTSRVPAPMQSAAIASTLQRFSALLEAQQAVNVDGKPVGLMELLDAIGERLAHRLVVDPFNENIRLTMTVPTLVRPEIHTLLVRAINTGALVHIPPRYSDGRLPGRLAGRQFRLAHLLSCKYGLPIHLTNSTSLDELLPSEWTVRGERNSRRYSGAEGDVDFDLFAAQNTAPEPLRDLERGSPE